jgi:hypothetical protein
MSYSSKNILVHRELSPCCILSAYIGTYCLDDNAETKLHPPPLYNKGLRLIALPQANAVSLLCLLRRSFYTGVGT